MLWQLNQYAYLMLLAGLVSAVVKGLPFACAGVPSFLNTYTRG